MQSLHAGTGTYRSTIAFRLVVRAVALWKSAPALLPTWARPSLGMYLSISELLAIPPEMHSGGTYPT